MRYFALKVGFLNIVSVLFLAVCFMEPSMAAPSFTTPTATTLNNPAQNSPSRKQLDEAYQRHLKTPQDRALALQYSNIATQLKDYEAAIPPLEGILINEPDNAGIKIQIGILYRALGSKLMAKQYFIDAENSPGVSPEITTKAEGYLRGL